MPARRHAVLATVDEALGMLDADAEGKRFCFNKYPSTQEDPEDVARTVARREHEIVGFDAFGSVNLDGHYAPVRFIQDDIGQAGIEPHLAAVHADHLAHPGDDPGQLVRPDMGMRVDANVRVGAALNEDAEHAVDRPAFHRARIEFSIRIRACPPFAETVVGMRIDDPLLLDGAQVAPPVLDILPALEHHRLQAMADQVERSEVSCGSGADNENRARMRDVRQILEPFLGGRKRFTLGDAHAQLVERRTKTRIKRATDDLVRAKTIRRDPGRLVESRPQQFFLSEFLGGYADIDLPYQ